MQVWGLYPAVSLAAECHRFGNSVVLNTSMKVYRDTKKEHVVSAISLKGCPIAVGFSQENKAYTPTAAVTAEWMEILLYCVYIFITCHSQKSRGNVTVQMWISGKVSAHLVLLKPRRDLHVENKSCGSAENNLESAERL